MMSAPATGLSHSIHTVCPGAIPSYRGASTVATTMPIGSRVSFSASGTFGATSSGAGSPTHNGNTWDSRGSLLPKYTR
ncbi:hypothetical protein D3C79_860790 [compost metagenome]